MALIGDVLVKFIADFAEFSSGMTKGIEQLNKFGKAAEDQAAKIDGFIGSVTKLAKGLGIAAGITAVANEFLKMAKAAEAASLEAEQLARRLGLSSEQAQALKVMSDKTGQSLDDLAKHGKQNVEWLEKITQEAKDAGLVIDNQYTR